MDAINRGTGLTRRILITGASGYLGSHLVRRVLALHPGSEIHAVYFTRCPRSLPVPTYSLDLRDRMAVIQFIEEVRPDIIIHTAAQTGSDGLQRNDSHGEAWATNVAGTSHLAESAIRIGARLIHVSTDVVFDGEHAPYREESPVHPLHRYGASKAEAERIVSGSSANAAIVRTSLIYGFDPVDPRTLAMLEGKMNRLYVDEYRNPIFVSDLADALIELGVGTYRGLLHVAGPHRLNRYEFGVKCVRALGGDWTRLIQASTTESLFVRPRDCTLDISRARQLLTTKLRGVEEVLRSLSGQASA